MATGHAYEEVLGALAPLLRRVESAAARLIPEQADATAAFLREITAAMRDDAAE